MGRWDEAINAKEMYVPPPKIEPVVDEIVSRIVGKKIYARDPRLIQLVVKWKKESNKRDDDLTPNNYLADPRKREKLKEVLNPNLK